MLFVGSNITVNTTLPLPLAQIGGLSASRTGLALLPAALTTILAARLSGWAVDTFGTVTPIRAGVAAVVVSLVLLSAFGVNGPLWAASILAAMASVGAVLAKVATTKAVSLSVPATAWRRPSRSTSRCGSSAPASGPSCSPRR